MMRAFAFGLMLLVLAGCGREALPPPVTSGGCISMYDNLKTLREGDALPRVLQVMGMPSRAYRAYSSFGRLYDVIEYDVPQNACNKVLLGAKDQKVRLGFDGKGGFVGFGDAVTLPKRWFGAVRLEALVIDPVVMEP